MVERELNRERGELLQHDDACDMCSFQAPNSLTAGT